MRAFFGWIWTRTGWDFAARRMCVPAVWPTEDEGRDIAWFRGDCPMADNVYPEECCDEPDACRDIAVRMKERDEAEAALRAELRRKEGS